MDGINKAEPDGLKGSRKQGWMVSVIEGKPPSAPCHREARSEETIKEYAALWQGGRTGLKDEKKAVIHSSCDVVPCYSFQFAGDDFILIGHNNTFGQKNVFNPDAYLGKKASEIFGDHPNMLNDIWKCYEGKNTSIRRVRRRMLPDGQNRERVVLYNFIAPDVVQVIVHDETELQLIRGVLNEHEKKYRSIFESALAGIYRYRIRDGKILMANQALANMLGYDSVRQFMAEYVDPKVYLSHDKRKMLIERLKQNGRIDNFEFEAVKRDGTLVPLFVSANYDPEQGYLDGVTINIQERKQAEEAIRDSRQRLRMLSAQLLSAQERERKQIVSELHDSIGQSLTAVKYGIESIIEELDIEPPAALKSELSAVLSIIKWITDEIRNIQANLRPPILDDLGLLAAVSWFCRKFQMIYSKIRVIRRLEIKESDIPEPLNIVIFRIMQEALNNVAKHSNAECAIISLSKIDSAVVLTVQDNGQGFNPKELFDVKKFLKGFGLHTMRERAELSGGRFEIDSDRAKGTMIRASWPLT